MADRLIAATPRRKQSLISRAFWFAAKSTVALLLAACTYAVFYWTYIPRKHFAWPLYLDYALKAPLATVLLPPDYSAYDVSVELQAPDLPHLVDYGNFMIELSIVGDADLVLLSSRRPALFGYRSAPVRLALKAVKLLPLMIGWSAEATSQRIFLSERIALSDSIRLFSVSIEKATVPLYSATLHINAHFSGLRYLMYYWFVSTATACIAAMWMACVGMLALGELLPTTAPFAEGVYGEGEGTAEDTEPGEEEPHESTDERMPAIRQRRTRSQIKDIDEEDECAVPDRDSSNSDSA